MSWTDVISMLLALASIVTVGLAWRKLRPEVHVIDSSAATQYAELVDRAAKRESEYQNRIDGLQRRIEALEACQNDLEEKIVLADKRADKFEGWAKRLAHQVQSLGAVPVPLEVTTK